jgi:predicted ATPase
LAGVSGAGPTPKQGEATTGIARIRDGLAAAEAAGTRLYTPFFLALLAEALALAGKIEEALATLDDALAKGPSPA